MTSTASNLEWDGPPSEPRPRPLNSLVAAAHRMTGKKVSRLGSTTSANSSGWQEDAWDMHDLVGEQRFLAHTLAGRLAQARFYVGRLPDDPTEEVVPVTSGPAVDVLASLTGRGSAFAQIVERAGVNLFLTGDCFLVGLPPEPEETLANPAGGLSPFGNPTEDILDGKVDISTLDWSLRSVSEVSFDKDGNVTLKSGHGRDSTTEYSADSIMLIRIWRPHPRYWWEPDSPTRSSLPVLRELVGLTMHISAQVDSRLAGAGVFLVPETADRAIRAAAGIPEDGDEDSPLTEALMEAMIAPISDRSSASALVPIMPVVPDDSIEKFRFISFAAPLDTEARSLRDEAIRRLALGQDCPPELLLGVGGMNHWGAWLVREDVVTTHLEPPLALLCDAITTQFLWPVLMQQGVDPEEVHKHVVWYDVDHMIMRPDRSKDAKDLYAAGVIGDATLRNATGFDESDAPEADPTNPAVKLTLDLVRGAPSLMQNPGLDVIATQIQAMLSGSEIPGLPEITTENENEAEAIDNSPDEEEPREGGTPVSSGPAGDSDAPEGIAASGITLPDGTTFSSDPGLGPIVPPDTKGLGIVATDEEEDDEHDDE